MNVYLIVIYVICGIYMTLNFKHDIHMLQQNSYRLDRYWRYLKNDMGSTWRLVDVAMLFLVFSDKQNQQNGEAQACFQGKLPQAASCPDSSV